MRNKSILLVDDEEIILNSLGRDLREEGYNITTATDGSEAVIKLREAPYDLVITDLIMTEINGIQVLKEAKDVNQEISVIILTGYGDMTSAIEALRLGADDYLIKPCDIDEMLIRIDRCLARQEVSRKIKLYEKIIPMCCVCGVIRDDTGVERGRGRWLKPDQFIIERSTAEVSHTYCPDCAKKTREKYNL